MSRMSELAIERKENNVVEARKKELRRLTLAKLRTVSIDEHNPNMLLAQEILKEKRLQAIDDDAEDRNLRPHTP